MENKKNILFWGFGHDSMCGVRHHLADDINIKVWIDKTKYPTITHDMKDFYRELRFSCKTNQLKIDYQHRKEFISIYPKIMEHANTFLYMYNRRPILNGENNFMDMMDALHIYIHYFIDLLKENEIQHAFFAEIPSHADFILYLVAKELHIKTFMFFPSAEPGKAFLTTDIEKIGSIETEDENIEPVQIKRNERRKYFYMNKKNIKTSDYIRIFSTFFHSLFFRKDMDLFFHRIMNIRKDIKFKKDYKRALVSTLPENKFVYFPLHFQPELTTASLGGIFVDQVLALEHLRALLPDDWNIVVKEHPMQRFYARGPLFFSRLKKIPGVFYVGRELDTFALIEKSEFVSTVTGTAGLEALNFGKRVLVFGNAIYQDLPGVIRYTDHLTFENIMSVHFSHEEVELAYAKLKHNMVEAVIHPDHSSLVENFSKERNAHALAGIINKATR